jgi:hypothetical protein
MDLRAYYQKIRRIEAGIQEPFAVVVSRKTPDGGRPGVKTDVPRTLAARMVADEKADLASSEEEARFRLEAEMRWRDEAVRPQRASKEKI